MKHSQRRARLVAEIGQASTKPATRLRSNGQEQLRARQVERCSGDRARRSTRTSTRSRVDKNRSKPTACQSTSTPPLIDRRENTKAAYLERYRKAQSATPFQSFPRLPTDLETYSTATTDAGRTSPRGSTRSKRCAPNGKRGNSRNCPTSAVGMDRPGPDELGNRPRLSHGGRPAI